MAKNTALNQAAQAKKDEFYTQLSDIEKELRHYKAFFKGKVVLCNCDDPYESNFFKYFAMNFNALGLKKLIATCYVSSPVAGSELGFYVGADGQISFVSQKGAVPMHEGGGRHAYCVEISEVKDENGDGRIDLADVEMLMRCNKNVMKLLKGDGDFRSDECVELLKQADVVVTNPPFSLFREYVAQLVKYEKNFLIIGNQNAIAYKDIFSLIMNNKVWTGYKSGDMAFTVPDSYEPRETRYWQDETGQKWRSMGNICWYTNIDIEKRHGDLILYKHYTPEEYPHYDNYDAIEVSRVAEIPCDYDGVMGVPITFIDKFNPDQFMILGNSLETAGPVTDKAGKFKKTPGRFYVGGNRKYDRILIKRKQAQNED